MVEESTIYKNNLETINFENKDDILDSPRSIEALHLVGIELKKLFHLTFKEYLVENPNFKNSEPVIQQKRYEHYEEKRKVKIAIAQAKRKEIIENPNYLKSSFKTSRYNDLSTSSINNQISNNYGSQLNSNTGLNKNESTAIIIAKQKMEKMKKRQVNIVKLRCKKFK